MKNYVQDERKVVVTAPYALASGAGCLVGTLFGVAEAAAAISTSVNLVTKGVFTLAKTTGQAWTQGLVLYWDNSTKLVTTTVGTNKQIGYAAQAQLAGDTTGNVVVLGV